jgi:hypothetical protein
MSTVSVDFHYVVLPVHIEDGLCLFVKSPLGMFSMSWGPSSQVDPMVTVHGGNSLHWHSGSHVEWSVDVEAKFLIHSLGCNLFRILDIDDLPFLVLSIMDLVDDNWLSFNIFCSRNIESLIVLDVDELFTSILEDLPPL